MASMSDIVESSAKMSLFDETEESECANNANTVQLCPGIGTSVKTLIRLIEVDPSSLSSHKSSNNVTVSTHQVQPNTGNSNVAECQTIIKENRKWQDSITCENGETPKDVVEKTILPEPDVKEAKEKATQPTQDMPEKDNRVYAESYCTEYPDIASQDDDDDIGISSIQEYMQRVLEFEERYNELEDVVARLVTAIAYNISQQTTDDKSDLPSRDIEEDHKVETEAKEDEPEMAAAQNSTDVPRGLILGLFSEFVQRNRRLAEDLNGVLNYSAEAMEHGRAAQVWATSVHLMLHRTREERHKLLNYIDEREKTMIIVKEQFIAELGEQGRTLKQLVEEMMSHHDLQQQSEEYSRTKVGESSSIRSTVEKVVDILLTRRLEEDRTIVLNLNQQSKISEMKLIVIQQQGCIQMLQEHNKELTAIIEGIVELDDLEEEEMSDTDQSGTPASTATPERCPIRDTLERQGNPAISLVSDVLYCDRAQYLPGTSTDGDIATVQAYSIGKGISEVQSGDEIVFDVNYVLKQCQLAEDCNGLARAADTVEADYIQQRTPATKPTVDTNQDVGSSQESGVSDKEVDSGFQTTIVEPYEITAAEQRFINRLSGDHEAAGDGVDVTSQKDVSPEKTYCALKSETK